MKKILILIIFLNGTVCAQEKFGIGYLEKLCQAEYPQNFIRFLKSTNEKICQFYFLNEKYQLIQLNDFKILESANRDIEILEALGCASSELRDYFGKDITVNLLPFATSLNHCSDDKIDFLGILKSNDSKLDGKIVYMNVDYTPILPAIVANNFDTFFKDIKSINTDSDTILLNVESADMTLYNLDVPKSSFEKTELSIQKRHKSLKLPDIINVEFSLSDSIGLQKIAVNAEWSHGASYYQQKFSFLDMNKPIEDARAYGNKLNWIDFTRLYTFLIKSLSEFKTEIAAKGGDLNTALSSLRIDHIYQNALFKYYINETSPEHTCVKEAITFPIELVSNLKVSPEYNFILEFNNDNFLLPHWNNGFVLDNITQDLELYVVQFDLSKKKYNGISDSLTVIPFAISNPGNGKVKYLSLINSNTDGFKKYNGKILSSNYSTWSSKASNSTLVCNSYKELIEKYPLKKKSKFDSIQPLLKFLEKKVSKYKIIEERNFRAYLPYVFISLEEHGGELYIIYEAQKREIRFETIYKVKLENNPIPYEKLYNIVLKCTLDFISRHNEIKEIALGLNPTVLVKYALYNYIQDNEK